MHDRTNCPYCHRRIQPLHDTIPKEPVRLICQNCEKVFEYIYGFGAYPLPIAEQDDDITIHPSRIYPAIIPNRRESVYYTLTCVVIFLIMFSMISTTFQIFAIVILVISENLPIAMILFGIGFIIVAIDSVAEYIKKVR